MEKKSYSELLKDPRWQKKRLEIMQRDKFECRACESSDTTLHVHHMVYHKGLMPWEYDNHDLMTLCEKCHEAMTYVYDGGYGWDTIYSVTELHMNWEYEGLNKDKDVV